MIGYIRGEIIAVEKDSVIVRSGDMGYKVHVLPIVLAHGIGETVELWTYLAVREDALDLFGFEAQNERALFGHLVGVSGIGPKSALGILAIAPAPMLASAITAGDTSYLTKVSGIGAKSAQKIVLELKDKLGELAGSAHQTLRQEESDALDALIALGYPAHKAREALKNIPEEIESVNEKIREALKSLGS